MDDREYCSKCGQNRSTHDDGECEMVVQSMSAPSLRRRLEEEHRNKQSAKKQEDTHA